MIGRGWYWIARPTDAGWITAYVDETGQLWDGPNQLEVNSYILVPIQPPDPSPAQMHAALMDEWEKEGITAELPQRRKTPSHLRVIEGGRHGKEP